MDNKNKKYKIMKSDYRRCLNYIEKCWKKLTFNLPKNKKLDLEVFKKTKDKKWLDMNKKVFNKTGKFWEKYDVVKYDVGKSGLYPTQSSFGWTNAIFLKLVNTFGE